MENVCIIGEAGEDIAEFLKQDSGTKETDKPAEKAAEEKAPEAQAPAAATAVPGDDQLKISPRARHLAENQNVDLSKTIPTGPQGRVIERDVAAAANQGYKVTTAAANAYAGGGAGTGLGGAGDHGGS